MLYGKPRKIFAVDDDPMILTMLQDHLTRDIPHEVEVFSSGEECLKHMYRNPEIVILDYQLSKDNSKADGMEILKEIHKNFPHVKVIMLSSQEKYSVAVQTVQKGAIEYIIKDEKAFEKIAYLINEMK